MVASEQSLLLDAGPKKSHLLLYVRICHYETLVKWQNKEGDIKKATKEITLSQFYGV